MALAVFDGRLRGEADIVHPRDPESILMTWYRIVKNDIRGALPRVVVRGRVNGQLFSRAARQETRKRKYRKNGKPTPRDESLSRHDGLLCAAPSRTRPCGLVLALDFTENGPLNWNSAPASSLVASHTMICMPLAIPQRRLARFTESPITVKSARRADPTMP